jgi:hypothetical protein
VTDPTAEKPPRLIGLRQSGKDAEPNFDRIIPNCWDVPLVGIFGWCLISVPVCAWIWIPNYF